MWSAPTTTVTSLLLRRFNKSVGSKSCRAARLLIHQTSFFIDHLHTTTFNSSSKFDGAGTFILQQQQQQQQANNLHTTTSSSSSKFGDDTFILQTYEPSHRGNQDDIKMFMLSTGSGSGSSGTTGEEDKDDDQNKKKKKKKKKKEKMVFKLDEDLGFSAIYKDFQLEDSIRMVGSCNGIICLHDPYVRLPDQLPRDVYLWNPATRHFRILPESIHIEERRISNSFDDFVGFGFDVETQDYKVLRISPFVSDSYRGDGCKCGVQVYSLSTDSWKLLDGIDSLPVSPTESPFENRQGTYLNGSCFFLGLKPVNDYGKLDLMLLSFDFTKEFFTIRKLPKCYYQKLVLSRMVEEELDIRALSRFHDKRLVFGSPVVFRTPRIDFAGGYVFTTDKLDDLSYSKGGGYCCHHSMWVMNEQDTPLAVVHKKKKSWAKFREFRIKSKSKHFYFKPRCVSNDGELALSTLTANGRKKWMLFNLVTEKATKDFTIGDHRDCRAAYVYNESQVSIMGAGNVLLRWQLPTPGTTYKLNLDAHHIGAYTGDYTKVGIGLCLTSDTGGCIGVRSLKTNVSDQEEGRAEVLFQAIKWAKELELSPIIIESDSEYGVSFFMEDVDDVYNSTYWRKTRTKAGSLLREAKCLLKSSENNISFQYCSSSCNYVADIASKLGRDETIWSCKDWKADSPGEVVMSLSMDLGVET